MTAAVVSNRDTTTAHVLEVLDRLGRTGVEVAAALELAGCRGEQGDCWDCPVATYLWRTVPGLIDVAVDIDDQVVLTFADRSVVAVATPAPIRQFIVAFDDDVFPQLVKGGAR